MNLLDAIKKISDEFPIAKKQPVKNHPLRKFIDKNILKLFKNSLDKKYDYLKISSSAQQGKR